MTTIDYSDPAAVLPILRAAYYQILSGSKAQTVDIPAAGGGSRRVTYHETDLAKLETEIRRLEALVAAITGAKPRRHCILAG